MNILISEDDSEILDLYKLVIAEEEGYNVFTAEDYSKTIDILQNKQIDLWVLDYWLGKVKAEELLTLLNKDNININFPILLISAVTNLPQIAENLNLNYLKKPFDLDELILKIKEIYKYDQNNSSN